MRRQTVCGLYKAPSITARRQEPQKVAFVLAEEPADIVTARVHAVVSHLLDELHSADDAQARAMGLVHEVWLLTPVEQAHQRAGKGEVVQRNFRFASETAPN